MSGVDRQYLMAQALGFDKAIEIQNMTGFGR
jgi:hypothetical protein